MTRSMTNMRKLFLLRHAKSNWDDAGMDDIDRPLAKRGRLAARAMARFLEVGHIRPALVLVSASRRTRSTWDIIEPKLEGVPVAIEDELYEAGRGTLLHRLRRLDDNIASVMLIGHNPGFTNLAQALTGNHGDSEALARLGAKFSTGALAEIELDIGRWSEIEAGTGRLVAFTRPKDLEPPPEPPAPTEP